MKWFVKHIVQRGAFFWHYLGNHLDMTDKSRHLCKRLKILAVVVFGFLKVVILFSNFLAITLTSQKSYYIAPQTRNSKFN